MNRLQRQIDRWRHPGEGRYQQGYRLYRQGIPQATPYEQTAARVVNPQLQGIYDRLVKEPGYELVGAPPAPVVGVTFDRYLVHEADYRPEHEYDEQPSDEPPLPVDADTGKEGDE